MEFEVDQQYIYAKDFPEEFTFTNEWLKQVSDYVSYDQERQRLFIEVRNGEAEYLVTPASHNYKAVRYYLRRKL